MVELKEEGQTLTPNEASREEKNVDIYNDIMDSQRGDLKQVASNMKSIIDDMKVTEFEDGVDTGEIIACAILCYRHLEDAAMRLGKVKQALNSGVNVYDKNTVGDPRE